MYFEKPLPFYMAYPFPQFYEDDREQERERRLMRSFYSRPARKIQELVDQEFDREENEGSMMFDEYPDKFMMSQICARIEEKFRAQEEDKEQAQALDCCGLRDLIGVILYNEMYRRRCRRRRCRRYF